MIKDRKCKTIKFSNICQYKDGVHTTFFTLRHRSQKKSDTRIVTYKIKFGYTMLLKYP